MAIFIQFPRLFNVVGTYLWGVSLQQAMTDYAIQTTYKYGRNTAWPNIHVFNLSPFVMKVLLDESPEIMHFGLS
jgi:hypothetical protein